MVSEYCLRRFSKCSSAALLSGCVKRILPAFCNCGVRLSMWLAQVISPSASRLLGALPEATFRAVCAALWEKFDKLMALSWKLASLLGVPSGANTASVNCFNGVVISMKSSTTRVTKAFSICFLRSWSFWDRFLARASAWGELPWPLRHMSFSCRLRDSTSLHSPRMSCLWAGMQYWAKRRPSSTIAWIAWEPNPLSSKPGLPNHLRACSTRPKTVCAGCWTPLLSTFWMALLTNPFNSLTFWSIPLASDWACGVPPFPSARSSHNALVVAVMSPTIFLMASLSVGRALSATLRA